MVEELVVEWLWTSACAALCQLPPRRPGAGAGSGPPRRPSPGLHTPPGALAWAVAAFM